jgi:hypothetical protein
MGGQNSTTIGGMSQRVKAVMILVAVAAFFVVLLLPSILHGLDRGEERVPASKLATGYAPASHNLVIEGLLDGDHVVDQMITDENGHTKSRTDFLPLVAPGWTPHDEVRVVYSVRAWGDFLKPHLEQKEHKGVLRDILWETRRLSSGVKAEFEKMGLRISDDVRLVESDDPPPQ